MEGGKLLSNMIKLLIFGTGTSSKRITDILDYNKVEIIGYLDNDKSKTGKSKDGILIDFPYNISFYDYDFVIIASQYNDEIYNQLILLEVDRNKIFQFYTFLSNNYNYYKANIENFISKHYMNTELLVTGISYARAGFSQSVCCRKSYNLAWWSQDLFFDYSTIKFIFENYNEKVNEIKYVIIGLSYYSFQYDMSLSAMKNKSILYYDVLKTAHHFNEIERIYKEYSIDKEIANKIFKKKESGQFNLQWRIPTLKDYKDKWEVGKKQAETDCNKNYPNTVVENIQIFNDYLSLLNTYKIKPIVVVFPASVYYTSNFSKTIEHEFQDIIKNTKNQYNLQYIDYFRTDLFDDEDFADVSHLNKKGSEKFTKILNDIIEW